LTHRLTTFVHLHLNVLVAVLKYAAAFGITPVAFLPFKGIHNRHALCSVRVILYLGRHQFQTQENVKLDRKYKHRI
jgi:hypothetical protein